METTKKVVWVTGASSGIGEALVGVLAKKPDHALILSSRNEKELQRVVEKYGLDSSRALIPPLDLEKRKLCKKPFQRRSKPGGR